MKKKIFLLVIVPLICCVYFFNRTSAQINGHRTYYVAPSGNDRNPGTLQSPFKTIQKAADLVNPGDMVIIRPGNYSTTGYQLVEIRRGGTPDNYVTFKSEKKWGAVLSGENKGEYGIIIGNGASYLKILDFEIKNFLWMGIHANDDKRQSNYITVEGNKIHDIGRVEDSGSNGRNGIYIRKKNHHWNITRNLFFNIGRTGPDIWWNKDHAVYIGYSETEGDAAHDNKITYNIIYSCSGQALQIYSRNDLVANNTFAWTNENSKSGTCFISVGRTTTNLVIANNIFYQPPAGNAYAIGTTYGCEGWEVKNNIVSGGRIWEPESAETGTRRALKSANFARTDSKLGEINPDFVSARNRHAPDVDFTLKSGSPAIDAGTDVGLTKDFFGNPISGKPDIGAIEHQKTTHSVKSKPEKKPSNY